jgi:REP-associated tyrosine transposase
MSRHRRGHIAAGTYHVTTRSAGPMPIFTDDVEYGRFCGLVARYVTRKKWTCLSFCVMSTHYHLLVDVPANTLQGGMQVINWSYARWFNARHGRSGHLFGERYYSGRIESDGHMLSALRYIARNPVSAGMCERPSDWRWSSYPSTIGKEKSFPFVDSTLFRGYFGSDPERIVAQIRQFVGDG